MSRTERRWDAAEDSFLEGLRDEGDRVADDAVAARAGGFDRRSLFGDTPATAGWIDDHFGADRPTRPDWVDDDLLLRGQAFFARQPWAVNIAFLLGSLPMSYGSAIGAGVLVRTGGLVEAARNRIFETALLVEELTELDGLGDGVDGRPLGKGYVTVLRLRLLHAAIRHDLLAEDWDAARDGRPISQLDLLGTLWCFALTSAHALREADREVDDDELEAWVHLWCVIGHHLGVRPDLLPMSAAEAQRCFDAVQRVSYQRSDAGRELMAALVEVGHDLVPLERFDQLVEALIRRNIGDTYADWLGVPDVGEGSLRFAERFWHLMTDEDAPDPDEPPDDDEGPAERLLRWVCARLLSSSPDLRSDEQRRHLLADVYGVSDLVDRVTQGRPLPPGAAGRARRPRDRPGRSGA